MRRSTFITFSLLLIVIASLINNYFINQINWDILNLQSNLFYDAYYYWQQGVSYHNLVGFKFNYDELNDISPTKNSIGVVYINSILYGLGFNIREIPVLIGSIYTILCLINFKKIDNSVGLVFISLLPINFLCSKESLIYIGIILIIGWIIDKKIWKLILGLIIIFVARNELFYIICIATILQYIKIKKISLIFLILVMWIFLKEQSLTSEYLFEKSNTLIFDGSLNYVMISSGTPELIVIFSRIFVSFLVPIKWLISLPTLINNDNPVSLLVDLTSFITLFYATYLGWRIIKTKFINKPLSINVVKYSFIIYVLVYMIIIFHQPTRQLLLAITAYLFIYCTVEKNYKLNT